MSRRRWGDPLARQPGRRQARVNDLLRREVGTIVQRHYADDLQVMATVTEVRTTGDLRHARVFVSVLGEREKQAAVIVHLQSQRQELRRLLADRVVMKYIPTLEFIIDDSAERAQHIEELLRSRDRRE